MEYEKLSAPTAGEKITITEDKQLNVPDHPIIPFIEGDGIGPDIWKASQPVFDSAIEKAYNGKRKVEWFEIFAGEKAVTTYGDNQWLPNDTIKAIKEHIEAIFIL